MSNILTGSGISIHWPSIVVISAVLVQNGLGIEGYLNELVKNAGNGKLRVIDSSQGIQPIATKTIEGKKPQKVGEEQAKYNPHIWLDPKRVIRQVENIREGLIAADPSGKARHAVRDALVRVDVIQFKDHLISGLSSGETKRILLAYCLVSPRRLLILDEAPGGIGYGS